MALKAVLANLDGLAENVANEYTKNEDDDKFYLDVDPVEGYALEDVAGLKNTLGTITKERKEAREKLKKFEGLDAAQAREDRARVEEMADWSPDDKVKQLMADREKQLTDKSIAELTAAEAKAAKAQGQLSGLLVKGAAMAALAKHSLVKGGAELLMPHIASQVRLVETESGEMAPRVFGPDGVERISLKPNSGSTPMGVEELVDTMKDNETFALAFAGSGASGSGASTSGPPASAPTDRTGMSSSQKIAEGLKATTPARKRQP